MAARKPTAASTPAPAATNGHRKPQSAAPMPATPAGKSVPAGKAARTGATGSRSR
jgi:hypothetical protein